MVPNLQNGKVSIAGRVCLRSETIPRAGIVFVCLALFTIQAIVLVDRVHGDVDTELAKDILVFVCQHHG